MAEDTKPAATAPEPTKTAAPATTSTATKTEDKPDEVTVVNNPADLAEPVETDDDGKPENFVALPDGRAGERGIMHFEGSVEKITKDGDRVMSSYVDFDNGERMAYKADEEAEKEATEAADANREKMADAGAKK